MANLQASHQISSLSRRLFFSNAQNPTRSRKIHQQRTRGGPHHHHYQYQYRYHLRVNSVGSDLVQQRPPSADDEVPIMIDQMGDVELGVVRKRSIDDVDDGKVVDEYLVTEHGWQVRRMVEDKSEMKKVAEVQAQAFYVPSLFFDDFFFHFFQAEVLAGLLYRLKNSPPDRYACLVAEPAMDNETSTMSQLQDDHHKLVGVVDATVLRDKDVLQHLGGPEEYLYVSGIAVSNDYRRQKVATALLKACEVISVLWGHECIVLRAYEDDKGAQALYTNAGYRLVSQDPPWLTWIGKKRRILMVKRLW